MRSKIGIAFLHGGKQGSWVWDEVCAAIALQCEEGAPELFTLDIPGCGTKRGRDVAALDLEDVITELADDLASIDRRLMLVGHSQAGTILPRLAAARRDQISKLVYISCSVPQDGQALMTMLGTSVQGSNDEEVGWPLNPTTHSSEQLLSAMFCNDMSIEERARFLDRLGKDDWPVACAATAACWGCDTVSDIPAGYVMALRDQILTPLWQERFAARFGVDRISRVDAGHQLLQTRPHAVAEILLAEIKDVA